MPMQLAADCDARCSVAHSLNTNAYYDYKRSLSVQLLAAFLQTFFICSTVMSNCAPEKKLMNETFKRWLVDLHWLMFFFDDGQPMVIYANFTGIQASVAGRAHAKFTTFRFSRLRILENVNTATLQFIAFRGFTTVFDGPGSIIFIECFS